MLLTYPLQNWDNFKVRAWRILLFNGVSLSGRPDNETSQSDIPNENQQILLRLL